MILKYCRLFSKILLLTCTYDISSAANFCMQNCSKPQFNSLYDFQIRKFRLSMVV